MNYTINVVIQILWYLILFLCLAHLIIESWICHILSINLPFFFKIYRLRSIRLQMQTFLWDQFLLAVNFCGALWTRSNKHWFPDLDMLIKMLYIWSEYESRAKLGIGCCCNFSKIFYNLSFIFWLKCNVQVIEKEAERIFLQ